MTSLSLPGASSRPFVASATVAWLGVTAGTAGGVIGLVAACVCVGCLVIAWRRRAYIVGSVAVLAVLAGLAHTARTEATLEVVVPPGPATVTGMATEDSVEGTTPIAVHLVDGRSVTAPAIVRGGAAVTAGTLLVAEGRIGPAGWWRGRPHAFSLSAHRVDDLGPANAWYAAADGVRRRVRARFGTDAGSALVRGFLIGDTSDVRDGDLAAMKRAGISHYVAVSGSNVAVFLGAVWVMVGPMALDARSRAVAGLCGVSLFVVVTRWEPSVVRAGVMAGLVLVARAIGYPLRVWGALGAAVTLVLLAAPELAGAVGFQLSVAATAGVVAAANAFPSIPWPPLRRAVAATVGAQVAVAPILLIWFGSVPLLSPVANVVAAPLVLISTLSGVVAVVTGAGPVAEFASAGAGAVLDVARIAAGWPQVGPPVVALLLAASSIRRTRFRATVVASVVVAVVAGAGSASLPAGTVVFLDVGQGDAAVIRSAGGAVVAIDGGPDPELYVGKLAQYGIERIDLAVVSHPHEDHVAGLAAAVERIPFGRLWHPGFADPGETFERLVADAERRGVTVEVPVVGRDYVVGDLHLSVIGPLRRYRSPNDQSLVVMVHAAIGTVLFPGDVETFAQADLGPIRADVLKVPHQGAATSDPEWLRSTGARLSVVSVGPNQFGHPDADILAVLAEFSKVVRTDEVGDVLVPLDAVPP